MTGAYGSGYRPRSKAMSPLVLALLALAVFGGLGVGLYVALRPGTQKGSGAAQKDRPAGPEVQASGSKLWEAFGEGEQRDEARYQGKTVEVSGIIHFKVTRDLEARVVEAVVLDGPQVLTEPNIIFRLAPKAAAASADLDYYSTLTLRGVCRGRQDNRRAFGGYVVILDNCEITSIKKYP